MFNFEKLEGWQRAIDFADAVYTATGEFPDSERFGLTNPMRLASGSARFWVNTEARGDL